MHPEVHSAPFLDKNPETHPDQAHPRAQIEKSAIRDALDALAADVESFVRREKLFTPGQRVLIACSGGVDSTMLVMVLFRLRDRLQISLHICHVHHGLRGDDADADAGAVEALATTLTLPIEIIRLTSLQEPRALKGSLQEAARVARYEALIAQAQKHACACIATGHTASDQVETVLHHLARGAGLHGLCGIPPKREPGIVRPLLEIPRARLEACAWQQGIAWREDASNASRTYTRNRIRQDLVPALRALNPNVERTLASSLRQLRREDALLERLTAELERAEWVERRQEGLRIDRNALRALDEALQARLLRRLLQSLMFRTQELSSLHIEVLLEKLQEQRGTRVLSLPGGVRAVLEPSHVLLTKEEGRSHLLGGWEGAVTGILAVPGQVELGNGLWMEARLEHVAPSPLDGQPTTWTTYFGEEALSGALSVRTPRLGDRFWPWGRAGDSSLAEFLSHQKIPRIQRRAWPLVVSGDRILWVAGLRRSSWFPVAPESGRCLVLSLRRDDLDVESSVE